MASKIDTEERRGSKYKGANLNFMTGNCIHNMTLTSGKTPEDSILKSWSGWSWGNLEELG